MLPKYIFFLGPSCDTYCKFLKVRRTNNLAYIACIPLETITVEVCGQYYQRVEWTFQFLIAQSGWWAADTRRPDQSGFGINTAAIRLWKTLSWSYQPIVLVLHHWSWSWALGVGLAKILIVVNGNFCELQPLFEKLFSVTATSDPVERIFCHGDRIRPHRARMSDETSCDFVFVYCYRQLVLRGKTTDVTLLLLNVTVLLAKACC